MSFKTLRRFHSILALGALLITLALVHSPTAHAQGPLGNSFTYQGQLNTSSSGYTGTCDFIFNLWDDPTSGSQIGADDSITAVTVSSGLFTVALNDTNEFGTTPFSGNKRYLKIQVRCPAGSGGYTTLSPRQEVTAAPNAMYATNAASAANATNAQQLNGLSSSSYLKVSDGPFVRMGGNSDAPFSGLVIGTTNDVPIKFTRFGITFWELCSPFSSIPNWRYDCASAFTGVTLGGGGGHTVSGSLATISGGKSNTVGTGATVAGGESNTASGAYASISGGLSNTAAGDYSFVVGRRAKNTNAAHDGVFLFADQTDADFSSAAANEFAARATGGVRFITNSAGTTGVTLSAGGGSWASVSDRNAKQNFSQINSREILQRVANMPILKWNYKTQDASVQHIGPMAQDFAAAFSVGEDDTHITTVDADGVALAAIQGLNEIVQAQQSEIKTLKLLLGIGVFGVIACLGACTFMLRAMKQNMVAIRGATK